MGNPQKLKNIPMKILFKATYRALKSASRKSIGRTLNNPHVRKGIVGVSTGAICLVVFGSTTTKAATGTVNVETKLRIREGATTETQILGRLENNDVVNIIGEEGDFYKIIIPSEIQSNYSEGYVHKDYVEVTEEISELKQKIPYQNYELMAKAVITAQNSSTNRNFNIALACQKLDGLILNPGEEFDWYGPNGVGNANAENGFKLATVINAGQYVNGYGGGVCQVSTALYNCIYKLDIEPDEIHHHSIPASYVAKGMDATVSFSAGKDFRFTNSKDYTIKFVVYSEGGKVTVKAYKICNPYNSLV